ncbi:MAG: ParB/RepB/Spo0J family partition protein [Lautropia sp.]|nr:ParB/RepB/Spo0J family partition protein [Lautropia sp.]
MSKKHKGGLGRGLDSLLGGDTPMLDEPPAAAATPAPAVASTTGDETIRELPLNLMQAGRYQPRTRMDETALQELADSIVEHGLLQPLVVRPIENGRYEIIAGERRFRAAALAQLTNVPVIVKEVSDENALALALIENIQREDLNPLEEAFAIQRLIDEFNYTHEQAAQAIGRSRSATSNLLRLLNLADTVQTMLLSGDIEMGHARALLSLDRAEQILMAHLVVQRKLSVRETERLVAQKVEENQGQAKFSAKRQADTVLDRDVARLRERIADHLNTTVEIISKAGGKGKLVIHFSSNDAFTGLLDRLKLTSAVSENADH